MKSGYQLEFERMVANGRQRAELDAVMRRLTAHAAEMQRAWRKVGISAAAAAKGMQRSFQAMQKAGVTAHETAHKGEQDA